MFQGHPVIGVVENRQGCFARKKIYLKGWVRIIGYPVSYVQGFTGNETIVHMDTITPLVIVEVK